MSREPVQTELWEPTSPPYGARPTEAAFWRGSIESRKLPRAQQRALGQFITPPAIARSIARPMAEDLARRDDAALRVVDPAAGSGVLAAALVESLAALERRPKRIELLLCEIDPRMRQSLARCADELTALCRSRGIRLAARIAAGDFLLGPTALAKQPVADAVIANPPYFKLARNDPRALAHPQGVHGQPNIYALFMVACARLLRPGGAFGFITPRSWTNGAYFRAAREQLRASMAIVGLHLFDSRVAHFEGDDVLQEALVTWGTAGAAQGPIRFSSSHGRLDLDAAAVSTHESGEILGPEPASPIVLPAGAPDTALSAWPLRLADLGLRVLTGPVVGFRAAAHLRPTRERTTVPMLWMQHVRRMSIHWPRDHRSEHIELNDRSDWMLLPNEPCVVLRRFSPKEDLRRCCAAPYPADLPGERIGFENHLNVIRGIAEALLPHACTGLAAWLNSSLVDAHLRRRLGSTQVNAVELRELPVPDLATLEAIGRALGDETSLERVDACVLALAQGSLPTRAQAA